MRFRCKLLIFIQLCLFFLASGCNFQKESSKDAEWMRHDGRLKVLSTTAMCSALVAGVGGEFIDCLTLIRGESDPHSYQLVKGDDEKFLYADLVFYSGLGLEHGPSLAHILENSEKSHSIGDYIRTVHPESIIFVNNTVDPHVWMDIGLWKEAIPFVEAILSLKLPEHAEKFRERASMLMQNFDNIDRAVKEKLSQIPEKARYLVSTHDAFNYFAKTYLATPDEAQTNGWEERACAPEGLAPDSQLSTADIQKMVEHLVRFQIRVVFAEANINRDSLKKLVDSLMRLGLQVEIAADPLYADSLGPENSDAETYLGMMQYDARIIYKALHDR